MKKTVLIDDIDGSAENVSTVTFALGGTTYEIDLSAHNARRLKDSFAEWIQHGRKVKNTRPSTRTSQSSLIRAWAKEHGIDVPARGKIPAHIYTAYEQAHKAHIHPQDVEPSQAPSPY